MADVETALKALLEAQTDITDDVSTRIYPLRLKQDVTLPAIRYQRISRPANLTHSGPSSMAMARIQFDIYGAINQYAAVKRIAQNMRQALNGYQGTVNGVVLDLVELDNEFEDYEEEVSNHRSTQDYRVWWQED